MIPALIARLKQEAIRRLCPEIADLRAQLEHTRRLASETQARCREAERTVDTWRSRCHDFEMQLGPLRSDLARAKADLDERHGPLLGPLAMERDQLRARVAELEALNQRMSLDYQKAICIAAKGGL